MLVIVNISIGKIRDWCDDPFHYASEAKWRAANPTSGYPTILGNVATGNAALTGNATLLCTPLVSGLLLAQCGSLINASSYYRACMDDIIATGDYGFAAAIIDAYTQDCGAQSADSPSTYTYSHMLLFWFSSLVLPTSTRTSIAYGPGIDQTVLVGVTTFTIQARDALNNTRTTGGDSFVVYSTPALPFSIVDHESGIYTVSYNASSLGIFVISVTDGANHVQTSPFTVSVISISGTFVSNFTVPV